SALLERMCERDTEAPGEVVVAGSGLADQLALRRLAERPYRALRRNARQGLDRLGDGRFGQLVVAMPPALRGDEEASVDEAAEVLAGGRRRDAGAGGELARRQRAAVHHGEDESGSRRLGEQRGGGCHVGVAVHAASRKTSGKRWRAASISRSRAGGRSCSSLRS